jgi:ABC-type polysaccharide/polyol phosphate export permease
MCEQKSFTDMPNALYFTAVFLGGEWGVVDFTWPGRIVCLFLCVVGIGLYSIPIGTLFDSFGAVLGLAGDEDEEEEEEEEDLPEQEKQ